MSGKLAEATPLKKVGLGRFVVDDFRASLVVFLVAVPLSLGVAVASGVPPALGPDHHDRGRR
jgi:MFS superfamily sulfate permease-like transporter